MNINEKDNKATIDGWKKKAKEVKSPNELLDFIRHLEKDYTHDYGTIVHAIAAGMLATLSAMDNGPQGGITGFQASCLMHELIPHLSMIEPPYHITSFRDLLYPQYEKKFDKVIDTQTWAYLQKKAAEQLASGVSNADGSVVDHWQSIVDGKVPFGFSVEET